MTPNRVRTILISIIISLLLTGLFIKTQALNLDHHYQLLVQIRQIKQADAIVNSDLLKSRFMLDSNYDNLVADWQIFQQNLQILSIFLQTSSVGKLPTVQQYWQAIVKVSEEKETAIERFKSQNAVLQNSEYYFPTISYKLLNKWSDYSQDVPVKATLEQLIHDFLIYQMNARQDLQSSVVADLDRLQLLAPQLPLESRLELNNLIAHGRKMLSLKSEMTEHLSYLLAIPTPQTIDALALDYETHHKQQLQESNVYRLILYLALIGLLLITVRSRIYWQTQILKTTNIQLEQQVNERTRILQKTLYDLQRSQAQLIQAEKMSSLGQLVAGIAHEVNNPINFIHANILPAETYIHELIQIINLYQQHYPTLHPEIQTYTESIDLEFVKKDFLHLITSMKIGSERIRDLVISLRNFSRLDESDKKQVNIHDGLNSTLLILQHRLQNLSSHGEIKIIKQYGDLPLITCYAGLLNQVFMNLLANAIDALEQKMSTDISPSITPTIWIQTKASDQGVTITIADNGSGIPESVKAEIFNPFFTTKSVGKGTGLGLALSYQIIVEKHGGKIECLSSAFQRTEFHIYLPFPVLHNLEVTTNLSL